MSLKIGIIGCGAIGYDHARRISEVLSGGKIVAVSDLKQENAQRVAAQFGAVVYADGHALIQSPEVEAVIVTTIGSTHKEFVMAAIAAGKAVFCEKPLATTAADAKAIVDAEVASGRHLVQVGFMRRYDRGYMQLKKLVEECKLGEVLLCHCMHRNPAVGNSYTTDMAITDTAIHEIDTMHWLLDDEYVSVQVLLGRKSKHAHENLHDPQLVIFTTKKGVLIELEISVNIQYGYDIHCQLVCEEGTAELPDPSSLTLRADAKIYRNLLVDWKDRFIEAYDREIQQWIHTTVKGIVEGPTAWDGYVAAVTADACVKSQFSGQAEAIDLSGKPEFYKS